MNDLLALLKREVLEHSSLWKVPLILLAVGVLIKISMTAGNLSLNVNTPDFLGLDDTVDGAVSSVVSRGLGWMNSLIAFVMLAVAVFYTLSCLYGERQDESILFWRSLPISDSMTIASKLMIGLILVPLLIVVSQILMAIVFMGGQSIEYIATYFTHTIEDSAKLIAWLMLPLISWCLLCSEIAKKNPFLLAFVAPVIVIALDGLFLDSGLSGLIVDRFSSSQRSSMLLLISGLGFSVVCIAVATVKRSQRI